MSLRFAFGAIIGMIVGFRVVVALTDVVLFAGGIAAGGLVGGFLAARYGRRFLEWLRHLQWFYP